MVAKLIISGSLDSRRQAISEILNQANFSASHPDLLYLDDTQKLGVEAAKKIRQHLSLKPYSARGRVVAVESANRFTVEAQNSLLKTLEEPPAEALILLGAEDEKNILPTVLSRCQVIRIRGAGGGDEDEEGFAKEAQTLTRANMEQRFEYIEKLDQKELFLQNLIKFYRSKLQSDPGCLTFVKELVQTEKWADSNGNLRAILEYLMLKLPTG